jgi:ABC-type phosphate transport system substrate-binding protein
LPAGNSPPHKFGDCKPLPGARLLPRVMATKALDLRALRRVLIGGVAIGWSTLSAAELRLAGSDLLGVEFSRSLYTFAGDAGLRLALAFDGSVSGLDAVRTGRADAALVVLPPNETSEMTGIERVTVAYLRLVILVHRDCPVEELTFEELAAIYGAGARPLARWGELGVDGEWADTAILPFAPEAGGGIAVEWFRQAVLGGRDLKSHVRRYPVRPGLAALFADEPRAMALAASLPPGVPAKVLAVASARPPGFLPSAENLHAGDYPLGMPLRIAFRPEGMPRIRVVLHYLLGDAAAQALAAAGLVAVPAPVRAQQVLALSGS